MNQPKQSQPAPDQADSDSTLASLLAATQSLLSRDEHGPQANPNSPQESSPAGDGFMTAVPAIGMLRVEGQDTVSFLQGQLTNDIELLQDGDSQWSGLCSPKGRLLATFLVCRQGDAFWMLLHRDLAAPIAKRLAMYVLRAKVKVSDVSGQWLAMGLAAAVPADVQGVQWPASMKTAGEDPIAIGMPDINIGDKPVARCLLMVSESRVEQTWQALKDQLPPRPSAWWRATEVVSGIAQVSPNIQEAFVPQMVNFELVGGVNFEKGCYTGQEVVARSQYLGKMKRRMFLASAPVAPEPGADVVDGADSKVGTVVSSGPGLAVGIDAESVFLFESRVDNGGSLQVAGDNVAPLDLPYQIPEPTPFVRPV